MESTMENPWPGDKRMKEFMVLTFVWLDIIIPACANFDSPLWIGRTWTNVCGSHSSFMLRGEGSALWLCPVIANAIDLQLELNLNLNPTWFVELMKIIVGAVKIAAKYNCDRCGNRRPMINDESVMKKTKNKKVSDFRNLKKKKKTVRNAAKYPGNSWVV